MADYQDELPDDGSVPPAVERLAAIRDELGEEGITEEEERVLAAWFPTSADAKNHRANLAELLTEQELAAVTYDVLDYYEEDLQTRAEWHETAVRGMRLMGVSSNRLRPPDFDGASDIVDSGLSEACVQFNARAMAEVWPEDGPVKSKVFGDADDDTRERAERQASFMNFQYTTHMPYAFHQMDKMLLRLPLEGSMFRKIHWNPSFGRLYGETCEAADVVVPYSAQDLDTTPRYAHMMRLTPNEVQRRIANGFYRDAPVYDNPDDSATHTAMHDELDRIERRTQGYEDQSGRHSLIEMLVEYDLSIDRDKKAAPSPPYIITVDWESQQCLAIRRAWREGDRHRRRIRNMTHYRMFPGFGFYGFGYYHLIGTLAEGSTATLRALLDSAGFANMQGGYVSTEVGLDDGDTPLGMGEWREVSGSPEDVQRGFYQVKYPEPSATMVTLYQHLESKLRRFVNTTDLDVGDAKSSNMPVGTVLALIEQSTRLQAGVHKRLRNGLSDEFRIVARANRDYLPEAYPYRVNGEKQLALRADFDSRLDIIPVADPTNVSNTQRMVRAQFIAERADLNPQIYDKHQVERRLLEASGVINIDEVLPDSGRVPRRDPVAEGQALLKALPVSAFPDQDHQAHLIVHQHWLSQLDPETQQLVYPAYMAHVAEHMGWAYRVQIQQRTGIMLPPPGLSATVKQSEQVPPEIENEVTAMVAASVQAIAAQQEAQGPPPTPEMVEAQAKVQREDAIAAAKLEREQREFEARQEREETEFANRLARQQDEQEAAERKAAHELMLATERERAMAAVKREEMVKDAELRRAIDRETAMAKLEHEDMAEDRRTSREADRDSREQKRAMDDDRRRASEEKRREQDSAAMKVASETATKTAKVLETLDKAIGDLGKRLEVVAKVGEQLEKLEGAVEGIDASMKALDERVKAESAAADKRRAIALSELDKLGDEELSAAADKMRTIN